MLLISAISLQALVGRSVFTHDKSGVRTDQLHIEPRVCHRIANLVKRSARYEHREGLTKGLSPNAAMPAAIPTMFASAIHIKKPFRVSFPKHT